jgi:hypothetical protein
MQLQQQKPTVANIVMHLQAVSLAQKSPLDVF